ncbi:DUF2000 domain-containing protein [Pseudomonas ficuserectae]|uniref:DUF2000 domain-containing protein n=5 Tax=Pseudomonas syringae group TaxID=136849 RepID=A0A3M4JB23_PSEVI|nr:MULTISPECIES: DUF2000 domain-containing protein [Pseudomonas]RVU52494.1 DUF2000 domain-containing protein [Pseudomonas syringae pv. syringae]ARA79824.1 hypothetical protein B5U27_06975 [Pseudomonas amygdali pv. lachrymans]AXH57171.1 DUF2000 domain-containing protein [Pseudomonas amygdali pv. lachrymans str. M301315]KKY55765.1 hypothetical protein AAY85_23670 [Pseudomonas amygdali pv. lachrymans]KPB99062.1 Uncharacterized protein AC501_4045 [Pseudomonas amygdali pv. lachrymans]
MNFDATLHKCVIVVDKSLGLGHAANAVSVIGVSMGRSVDGLVGPDMQSRDSVNYPGVIYAPLPILLSSNESLRELQEKALADDEIFSIPFSALAQSCKTYQEYESRISEADSSSIELVAIGLIGPKKKISKLSGNFPLFK